MHHRRWANLSLRLIWWCSSSYWMIAATLKFKLVDWESLSDFDSRRGSPNWILQFHSAASKFPTNLPTLLLRRLQMQNNSHCVHKWIRKWVKNRFLSKRKWPPASATVYRASSWCLWTRSSSPVIGNSFKMVQLTTYSLIAYQCLYLAGFPTTAVWLSCRLHRSASLYSYSSSWK